MSATKLSFRADADAVDTTVLVGKKDVVKSMALKREVIDETTLEAMLGSISGSGSASTFLSSGKKLSLCVLPDEVSRQNHPLSVHKLSTLVGSASYKNTAVHVGGVTHSAPIAAAVARSFPLYDRKTSGKSDDKEEVTVSIASFDNDGNELTEDRAAEEAVAEGVRLASRLGDTTPEELTTDAFAEECKKVADRFDSVTMTQIVGEELRDKGYGGLWGVGKGAECPPRLIILDYTPSTSTPSQTVALVGKGIMYDTGGLALKPKQSMCGMKSDMCGAAGMLGALQAAAQLEVDSKVQVLLCVAENAIGPKAFRHDDILTLYSGKTVEINNSDAEGRLVLGDGVAHASKHLEGCDLIIDMATLTGAQMVTAGLKHAGILANNADLEHRAVQAGLVSGDLTFPLLYAPELLKDEFKSKVADMRNSVKDRMNAQASCAGHFVESHLDSDYKGGWLHVDMAGPSFVDQRATGYGVGLILALLGAPGFKA